MSRATGDLISEAGDRIMALSGKDPATAGLLRRMNAELLRLQRFEPPDPSRTGCMLCDMVTDRPPVNGFHVAGEWKARCTRK